MGTENEKKHNRWVACIIKGTGGSVKGRAPLRGVFWFGIVVCVLYLTRTFVGQILPPAFISEVRLHYSPHM